MRLFSRLLICVLLLFFFSGVVSAQVEEDLNLSDLFKVLNKSNYYIKITPNSLNGDLLVTWVNSDYVQNRICAVLLRTGKKVKVKHAFLATVKVPEFEIESYDVAFHPLDNQYYLVWSFRKGSNDFRMQNGLMGRSIDAGKGKRGATLILKDNPELSYEYPVIAPVLNNPGEYALASSVMPMNFEAENNTEKLELSSFSGLTGEISKNETLMERKLRKAAIFSNIYLEKMINTGKDNFVILGEQYRNNGSFGGQIFVIKTNSMLSPESNFELKKSSAEATWSSLDWNGRRFQLSFFILAGGTIQSLTLDKKLKRLEKVNINEHGEWTPTATLFLEKGKKAVLFARAKEVVITIINNKGKIISQTSLNMKEDSSLILDLKAVFQNGKMYIAVQDYTVKQRSRIILFSLPVETLF